MYTRRMLNIGKWEQSNPGFRISSCMHISRPALNFVYCRTSRYEQLMEKYLDETNDLALSSLQTHLEALSVRVHNSIE